MIQNIKQHNIQNNKEAMSLNLLGLLYQARPEEGIEPRTSTPTDNPIEDFLSIERAREHPI